MSHLDSYGKAIRRYVGTGSLELEEGAQISCRFELVQTAAGRLVALCQRDDRDLYLSLSDGTCRLEGKVEDGRRLQLDDGTILRSNAHTRYGEADVASSSHVVLSGSWVLVEAPNKLEGPATLSFALTNIDLLGTDSYSGKDPDGSEWSRRQQSLTLGQQEVVIRPLPEHGEIMRGVQASRGIDVSCELLIASGCADQADEAIELADNLCLLLTLARGCRVEWLCYDVVDSAGQVLRSYHRSAITKPWGSLQLIATDPPEDTKCFLEVAYPRLRQAEEYWELRNAISAYTDGTAEGDFLESRALKLAVTMEHLVGRFLAQTNSVHIVPQEGFRAELPDLVEEVCGILTRKFPDATSEQLQMMANHVQGFNWYPFRRALSELCKALGLSISRSDRNRLKTVRDELVHRASFHPSHGTPEEQYFFMMTFIGKILLGILGYDGYYYDWTKPRGWIGKDMEMRVKLDLRL